jgi:hypothetical protein
MPSKTTKKKQEIIRIVPPIPTKKAKALAQAAPAHFTYRGGPLLSNVEVLNIFWGKNWPTTLANTMENIDNFTDFIVTSSYINQLQEYGVPNHPIGFGQHANSYIVTDALLPPLLPDLLIRRMITKRITNGIFIPPNPNTLYFVYLPPGVKVQAGFGLSCLNFCGYHDAIGSQIYYAVIPYPDCSPCRKGMPIFNALTVVASHELAEAITDPKPGTGWYDNTYGEIGDICAWKTKQLGGYTVQLEWSNTANGCV